MTQHIIMIYRVYIITGKRKRATSPLERHTTESPITHVIATYHILCHIRSLIVFRRIFANIRPISFSWLVETQNPWLWLVRSCEGRHDEQQQFWSKSLFLEERILTGDSSGSYGLYRCRAQHDRYYKQALNIIYRQKYRMIKKGIFLKLGKILPPS